MNTSKIAVLLAAYNGEDFIDEQIDSILNQSSVSIDIYISLDLSTDNSKKIIETYMNKYKNIFLISDEKRFGSAAPNFFYLLKNVSFENYDFIALSDQDDIWLNEKLFRAVTVLINTESDGYSSDVTAFWPDGSTKLIKKSYEQRKYDHYFEGPGPGCTFVLKKQLAIVLQGHLNTNSSLLTQIDWHDWFIYSFARHYDFKWAIDDNPMMKYRQHANNQLGANSGLKSFVRRFKTIFSGYAILQARSNVASFSNSNEFVQKWRKNSKTGLFNLLFSFNNCRRKKIDRYYFLFACFFMVFSKKLKD